VACRPVFTIHNLNYGADLIGKAMESSAVATTVSPTYAMEIAGHAAVSPHLGKLFGVRNGIDMDIWDPSCDTFLPVKYSMSNFHEGKVSFSPSLLSALGCTTCTTIAPLQDSKFKSYIAESAPTNMSTHGKYPERHGSGLML
jgi:hypothetical protein